MTESGLLPGSVTGSGSRGLPVLDRLLEHPWLVDVSLAVGLSVLAQVELPSNTSLGIRVAVLCATGALVARSVAPVAMAVVVATATAAMGLAETPPSVFGLYLAVMFVSFSVAAALPLTRALATGLLLAAGIGLHDLASPRFGTPAGLASDLALPVLLWGLGRIVHAQRVRADSASVTVGRLQEERDAVARAAVEAERVRLSRELHDIVTHSLSVIVIQAQGAGRVLDDSPATTAQALQVIETAGRTALTEMRHLLGLLRTAEPGTDPPSLAPQPGLEDLVELVDRVHAAGLRVRLLRSEDLPAIPPGVSLALYRIAQEALTNCLKHAPGAAVTVELGRRNGSIELRVASGPGATPDAPAPRGPGRGLLGMRERVAVYGGTLDAGPDANGGFTVDARLPVEQG